MKRLLSILLSIVIVFSCFTCVTMITANASITVFSQTDSRWGNHYYGYSNAACTQRATISSGGCGILAYVNAIYYLNGCFIDPIFLADYSVNNGHRVNGQGTAYSLYKAFANSYGSNYGFSYAGSTSSYSTLASHLKSGGVAVGSAPGHLMAVVDYDSVTGKYLILDSYKSSNRYTYETGYTWQTESVIESTAKLNFSHFELLKSSGLVITSANGDNHTEITIKWSKVDKATKYTLERRKAGDSGYSTVKSSLTDTSYTDTGLNKNQRYYYKVTAYNGSTKLGTSEPVGVYTKFNSPNIEAVSDTKLKITWDSVAKAESYTVMRRKAGDDEYKEINTVTGTSHTDSGLSASTQYYYWIKANCNVDGTDITAKSTSSGQYTLTKAPVISKVDDISQSEIKITWNAVSGASSYRIDRRKAGDSAYKTIKSGLTTTTFNDTGLETGQRYYYIVYAKNSAGESAASTAAGGYTKFNAPTVKSANTSQLNLSWGSVSYAESYTIKRKLYNGEYASIKTVTETSYTDSGLQNGTQYFYWIQADCNVDGTDLVAKTVSKGQYTFMERAEVLSTSSTSVTLEWYAVRGNSTYKYEVLRSAVGENNFKVIATTTNTTYTDNNLSPSSGYVYKIKAFDSNSNYCTETLDAIRVNTSDCSHSYTSTTTPPTCTSNGTKTYTCTICGDEYTETIPPTGHSEVIDKGYDATETMDGLTDGKHCSVCGKVLVAQEIIPAKGEPSTGGEDNTTNSDTIEVLGDVNEDGVVNIKDATAIQKHIASIEFLSEDGHKAADVDASGDINIKDATAIQKHIAGIDTGYIIGKH